MWSTIVTLTLVAAAVLSNPKATHVEPPILPPSVSVAADPRAYLALFAHTLCIVPGPGCSVNAKMSLTPYHVSSFGVEATLGGNLSIPHLASTLLIVPPRPTLSRIVASAGRTTPTTPVLAVFYCKFSPIGGSIPIVRSGPICLRACVRLLGQLASYMPSFRKGGVEVSAPRVSSMPACGGRPSLRLRSKPLVMCWLFVTAMADCALMWTPLSFFQCLGFVIQWRTATLVVP